MLYPSVIQKVRKFLQSEGNIPHMYLDFRKNKKGEILKGLVTVGIGHLLSLNDAKKRPFRRKSDGSLVTDPSEIEKEWNEVDKRQDLSPLGSKAFEPVTKLKLSAEDIEKIFSEDVNNVASGLKKEKEFADLDKWPADAQMGLLAMFFAKGNLTDFIEFKKAIAAKDFDWAAKESKMQLVAPQRNKDIAHLFRNAARVWEANSPDKTYATLGYIMSVVYWPQELHARDDGSADGGSSQIEPMSYAP